MPDLGFSQYQKLSQEQTLSPQIIRALNLLQTPSLELEREISEELAKNPLLELADDGRSPLATQLPENPETVRPQPAKDSVESGEENVLQREDWRERDDFPNYNTRTWTSDDEERRAHLFNSLVEKHSLHDVLDEQIGLADVDAKTRNILQAIADRLDEKGFLEVPVEALAEEIGASVKKVEVALAIFQTFDPAGIGARNLRELFKIQLLRSGREKSLAYRIVDEAYDMFLGRKFSAIADRFGVSDSALRDAIEEISRINRVPAKDFIADENREILPDLTFYFDSAAGRWVVKSNFDYVPKLRISRDYKQMLATGKIPEKERSYFTEKLRDGKSLINALEERCKTVEKIGNVLLEIQQDFLEKGPTALHPMTMADVAAKIEMHETTVSRAVANKYAETPWGVWELRKFFTAAIATDSGVAMSNAGVREVLKEILAEEVPTAPLSDEKIVDEMAKRGIQVARRTVAKYRSILNIPPAHLRRKF